MIKILHRVNCPEQLVNIDRAYGVEMDVHAYGEKLVVHHDAFHDGPELSEWLEACGSRFVIFNIKEEGIESRVRDLALKFGIVDYFLLDLSFPALIKMVRNGESRIAIRVSEFEAIENALLLESQVEWIWLDCFEGFPLTKEDCQQLKGCDLKICLVSPELHGGSRSKNDIYIFQEKLKDLNMDIDAVCSKYPELW